MRVVWSAGVKRWNWMRGRGPAALLLVAQSATVVMVAVSEVSDALVAGLLLATAMQAAAFAMVQRRGDEPADSDEQLQRMLALVPGLVYRYRLRPDGTGHFPWMSGRLAAIAGVDPATVRDSDSAMMSRVVPEDRELMAQTIAESARDLSPWRQVFRFELPSVGMRWFDGHSLPYRQPDGSILWHGMLTDVTEQKAAERELRKLAMVADRLESAVVLTDARGRIEWVNSTFESLTGVSGAEVRGMLRDQLLADAGADPEVVQRLHADVLAARPFNLDLQVRGEQGVRWLHIDGRPLHGGSGEVEHFVILENDVTARKASEQALRESEERYAVAVQGSQDGIWDWDLRRDTVYYAPRWQEMLGLRPGQVSDAPAELLDRIVGRDQAQFQADLAAHVQGRSPQLESQIEMRHADGRTRYMLCRAVAMRDAAGQAVRLAGSLTDITQMRETQQQLRYLAEHDPLTGLLSRSAFMQRLTEAIERRQSDPSRTFAVLFLDFDHFKFINDALSHAAGDALLRAGAGVIRRNLRILDPAARFGGDEFAILLHDVDGVEGACAVAGKLLETLAQPQRVDDQQIRCGASIGIVLSDHAHADAAAILRDADAAMYAAKRSGRGTYRLFDTAMHQAALQRVRLERGLVAARHDQEFFLAYQPVVDLDTAEVTGYEALVRWQHPELGLVRPDQFITLAEETGEITRLGAWVLARACEQAQRWRKQGIGRDDAVMHVNVSRRQLMQGDFADIVDRTLRQSHLPPHLLKLEITESIIMDGRGEVVPVLEQLRELGVGLAIDDFGTGHSSLSCLHQFPVDTLKIDRSFIQPMSNDRQFAGVVAAVISLAEHLNMGVVAEGIETPEQLVQLQTLGCRLGQGYFFARPEPASDMTSYLIGLRRARSA